MNRTVSKGFTLIELLIVIAVIGVLSAGVLTAINITGQLIKANLSKAKTFAASVENSLGFDQVGKWDFNDSSDLGKDSSGTIIMEQFKEERHLEHLHHANWGLAGALISQTTLRINVLSCL